MVEPQDQGATDGGASRPWPDGASGSPHADAGQAASQQGSTSESGVLTGAPSGGEWLGREHRRLERYPVQASRPIALRLIDPDGQPEGRWILADILDISCGGLCLLVTGPLQLAMEQRLQMDVRCHPDFGTLRLESMVRWCRSSRSFTTLGVAFLQPLQHLPKLELERRSVRRDPNSEAWAQE